MRKVRLRQGPRGASRRELNAGRREEGEKEKLSRYIRRLLSVVVGPHRWCVMMEASADTAHSPHSPPMHEWGMRGGRVALVLLSKDALELEYKWM